MAYHTVYRVPVVQSRSGSRHFALSGRYLGSALAAGAIGALAMGIYVMIASAVMGAGWYAPLHMIAAAVPAFRPPPAEFMIGVAFVGLGLHMITGMVWGLVYALVVDPIPRPAGRPWTAAVLGLAWGVAAWLLMGQWIGPWINPALEQADPAHYFIGHLLFGLCTALSLAAFVRSRKQTDPERRWK